VKLLLLLENPFVTLHLNLSHYYMYKYTFGYASLESKPKKKKELNFNKLHRVGKIIPSWDNFKNSNSVLNGHFFYYVYCHEVNPYNSTFFKKKRILWKFEFIYFSRQTVWIPAATRMNKILVKSPHNQEYNDQFRFVKKHDCNNNILWILIFAYYVYSVYYVSILLIEKLTKVKVTFVYISRVIFFYVFLFCSYIIKYVIEYNILM